MAAHQAPLSLEFSRQEHWSVLPFPFQCMKVKSESEVAQLCQTLGDPMDHSLPGYGTKSGLTITGVPGVSAYNPWWLAPWPHACSTYSRCGMEQSLTLAPTHLFLLCPGELTGQIREHTQRLRRSWYLLYWPLTFAMDRLTQWWLLHLRNLLHT